MNKILVILNPAARGQRAKSLREKIQALSLKAVVRETVQPGDAKAMARLGVDEGFRVIVAAGGDGTINEVVNGMGGSRAMLGILPAGTMNVFAMELGIPSSLDAAWRIIEEGHVRRIDLPVADGEYFVQLAGAGLDAEVVRNTPLDSKKMLGPLSYVLSLAQLTARKPPQIHLKLGDGMEREGCFVLIGNGRYYGGPLMLFKNAKLDDGLLDVVIFKNQSPWDTMRYIHAILTGSHEKLDDVEYLQTPSVSLSSKSPVSVELDGEIAGRLPRHFSLRPRGLNVLVDAGASG